MASSVFKPSDPRAATASPVASRPRPPLAPPLAALGRRDGPDRRLDALAHPARRQDVRALARGRALDPRLLLRRPGAHRAASLAHGPSAHPRPAARCAGRPREAARLQRAPRNVRRAPLAARRPRRPARAAPALTAATPLVRRTTTSPTPVRSRPRARSERPCRRGARCADYGQNTKIRETLNNLSAPPRHGDGAQFPPSHPPSHPLTRARARAVLKAPQEWHTQVALPFVRVRRARSLPARPNAALTRAGAVRRSRAPFVRLRTRAARAPADAC